MSSSIASRLVACTVATCQLVFSVMAAVPATSLAQDIDIDPPVIELQAVDEGVRGETQVFSSTVTDNEEVTSVTLHFRTDPDGVYEAREMKSIGGSDIYTISIETEDKSAELIQYYLEARDRGGNRTIQGFAFDPLERRLVTPEDRATDPAPAPATQNGPVAEPAAQEMSTGRKVLYGVLGVLVVGAIAAGASSGGGDDNGGSGPTGPDIPLTITVEPPQP